MEIKTLPANGNPRAPVLELVRNKSSSEEVSRLRVAQVGVGRFGAQRRARMRETGLYDLVAIYDWNAEALEAAAAEDGAKTAGNYAELLETPGLDAVIIATGAKFHADQAIAAMEKGLHIFVEKPLCSTPQEMRDMLETQERTGVVAAIGHVDHRFDVVARATRSMIERGELGSITAFEATTAHSGGLHIKPGDWRGDPDRNPGGMLFHCGVHTIFELMFYFGPVQSVSCVLRGDVHDTLTPDAGHCILTFASGITGVLNAYHVTPYHHTFRVFGTEANLYREHFNSRVRLWKQKRHPKRFQETKEPVEILGEEDHCGNLRSFYHAVRKGNAPHPSWLDGAHALAVVFAAVESAQAGCSVDVARFQEGQGLGKLPASSNS